LPLGLIAGVLKETWPGERRVAVAPRAVDLITKIGAELWVERGAGAEAGFPDAEYAAKGAHLADSAGEVREKAEILLQVRASDADGLSPRHTIIAFADPLNEPQIAAEIARRGATLLAMEFIPRITRAQSMDALSSMATVAGYKAVLIAANALPRMFPMLMTAAGTVPPARAFVIGAGVAGLQAISTARRLGAVVVAYDVRPAVKEQIASLGAKFVSMDLDTSKAEGAGGYAQAAGEEFYRRQRELMASVLKDQDVVITTAAIPGRKAPVLITREMLAGMAPGSVIVDLAAERGGNCEATQPGQTVVAEGVTVMGPLNLTSTVPYHASQMYARNVAALLKHLVKDGQLNIDTADEITREALVTRGGAVVNPKVLELLAAPVGTNRGA
jgi:H+-translocating NAD(P) transhydrogenase subunit alpha